MGEELRGERFLIASRLERAESNYNMHTSRELPELRAGSNIVQNPRTKLWDIYRVVVEVGQYRRYHVRTQSGHILVRNCRFLHRHVPLILVNISPDATTSHTSSPSHPDSGPRAIPTPAQQDSPTLTAWQDPPSPPAQQDPPMPPPPPPGPMMWTTKDLWPPPLSH